MTRRDFELIARAIYTASERGYTGHVTLALADALRASNPRFDSDRFVQACLTGDMGR
jgi:hypothetical protein